MGTFGTYCGTLDVLYQAQIMGTQLKYFDDAIFANYIKDTMIPMAEGFVNTKCGYSFGTPSFGTLNIDGNGKSFLMLPVSFNPAIGFAAGSIDSTAITMANLKTYGRHVKLTSGIFTDGEQNVVLYGSYGYLDGHRAAIIPGDIQMVTARLCTNVISDMNRRHMLPDVFMNLFGDRKQAQGSTFHALFASPKIFSPYLKETLEPYRVRWVEVG